MIISGVLASQSWPRMLITFVARRQTPNNMLKGFREYPSWGKYYKLMAVIY